LNVPLSALRVFEAAARHQSFRLAGTELHMSGSAVSQQIATLEAILRSRLFTRINRGVVLSETGRTLAQALRKTFQDIDAALIAAAPHLATNTVRVAIYQTMASRWLISRLADLANHSPLLSVELETGMAEIDFAQSELDFAIRVGTGDWKNATATKLFDEVLIPVCSPAMAACLGRIDDLNTVSLIHSLNRPHDWEAWLVAAGHPGITGRSQLRLANSSLAYEAAAAGAGAAMGQAAFVAGDLASGVLVAPYGLEVPTGRAYYLLEPAVRPARPASTAFRRWILEQSR
jgi:LysR family glycine cleavage system transcriptional activator